MQREIKFKAKINKAGEVEGLSDWQYFDIFDLMNYPGLKELVDWDTLGQFTGLKDQNGKEIYGGDVVQTYMSASTGSKRLKCDRHIIRYFEHAFCMADHDDSNPVDCIWYYDFEVIGNQYDNPELILAKD